MINHAGIRSSNMRKLLIVKYLTSLLLRKWFADSKVTNEYQLCNFFKTLLFGSAFSFITWKRSIVQILFNSDFSGKITKTRPKLQISKVCLIWIHFEKPMQFSITSLQVVKPNMWGLTNIQKQLLWYMVWQIPFTKSRPL